MSTADRPVLTDDPGQVVKLTGPNSVHHPGPLPDQVTPDVHQLGGGENFEGSRMEDAARVLTDLAAVADEHAQACRHSEWVDAMEDLQRAERAFRRVFFPDATKVVARPTAVAVTRTDVVYETDPAPSSSAASEGGAV